MVAAPYVSSLREPAAYGETLEGTAEASERFLDRGAGSRRVVPRHSPRSALVHRSRNARRRVSLGGSASLSLRARPAPRRAPQETRARARRLRPPTRWEGAFARRPF